MSDYFPRRYKRFDGNINVKVDLSNYATKTDLKNVSHVDVNSFALKSNLASLKTEIDKIDAEKIKTVPVDLAKLSNVVKNDVIKKTEYDKLVAKVNGIDNTNFVSRTQYDKDGSDFEDKIDKIDKKYLMLLTWFKKTDFNTKVTEIEGKIPDVSNLVKKTDFDTRFKKNSDRVTKNKGKHLPVQNEIRKLQKFDSYYFIGKSHFEEDGTQNYLVFQSIHKYFKKISNSDYIYSWKSKGLSDETIDSITTSNNKITPELNYYGT